MPVTEWQLAEHPVRPAPGRVRIVTAAACLAMLFVPPLGAQAPRRIRDVRVTILSTMLADAGIGEWGFAALVEADGRRILFDTGARPRTVLENARELGVHLAGARELILSHNHTDHTGGLMTLRTEMAWENAEALRVAHVARGIFHSRPTAAGEGNGMIGVRKEYEKAGGAFVEHDKPVEIFPGAWLTGPVPRKYPERNWSGSGKVRSGANLVEDSIPEDMSLVLDTERGLIVVSGCGHAGIVNTLEYARTVVRRAPIHAAIGGFHLFAASGESLDWTAGKLKEFGVEHFVGAHCTGIEAVYRIREKAGMTRATAVVGAVGASFLTGNGISPRNVAR